MGRVRRNARLVFALTAAMRLRKQTGEGLSRIIGSEKHTFVQQRLGLRRQPAEAKRSEDWSVAATVLSNGAAYMIALIPPKPVSLPLRGIATALQNLAAGRVVSCIFAVC
jgi:hypothetical protein